MSLDLIIEIAGVITGLLGVYLTIKEDVLCWPVGIVNILLYIYIFSTSKLYADTLLQVCFLILSLYGWWKWNQPEKTMHKHLKISRLRKRSIAILFLLNIYLIFMTGYNFKNYTDAAYPYPDSSIMMLSLTAQYLQARKFLECWYVWLLVEIIAVSVYWLKGLKLTSGLYALFFFLAIIGLIRWKKVLSGQSRPLT